eukprot:5177559-Amphidinium_carterae.1
MSNAAPPLQFVEVAINQIVSPQLSHFLHLCWKFKCHQEGYNPDAQCIRINFDPLNARPVLSPSDLVAQSDRN